MQIIQCNTCRIPAFVWGGYEDLFTTHGVHNYAIFTIFRSLSWPTCLTRTLTTGGWAAGPAGPSLQGSGAGRDLPVPSQSRGRRRRTYKNVPDRLCPTHGRSPGWGNLALYFGTAPSFHPSRYLTDWGVPCRKTYLTTRCERPGAQNYALTQSNSLSQRKISHSASCA